MLSLSDQYLAGDRRSTGNDTAWTDRDRLDRERMEFKPRAAVRHDLTPVASTTPETRSGSARQGA